MTIDVRKRDNPDILRQFWQVEVTAGHPTILKGSVGKLHDDTQFVVTNDDAKRMFHNLCYMLREMEWTAEEREEFLTILLGEES